MAHWSEDAHALKLKRISLAMMQRIPEDVRGITDAYVVILPPVSRHEDYCRPLQNIGKIVADTISKIQKGSTIAVIGEIVDLIQTQINIPNNSRYQHLIAIKRETLIEFENKGLPAAHFGALILTNYIESLRHTKTRIKYTYCPECDRTTKDYGGKKHTYHNYGTLLSDVWRDIPCDLGGDLSPIIKRFQDLFGIEQHHNLNLIDLRDASIPRGEANYPDLSTIGDVFSVSEKGEEEYNASSREYLQTSYFASINKDKSFNNNESNLPKDFRNRILMGDCLEWLSKIPSDCVDFVFVDPPYNLGKAYLGYEDDLEIRDYFTWCDNWLTQLARVLKPGRTLSILNIPIWSIRHFSFLDGILNFQNWIVWDALAYPVRRIMPANYSILTFTKSKSRELPGLVNESGSLEIQGAPLAFNALHPLAEDYCIRSSCVRNRIALGINDRENI
ncbi:MAG: hypothetical protein IH859_00225, partial [Chloroflexi bacterium]|nr:hypothetical protein [Chloroflexota bacterium]